MVQTQTCSANRDGGGESREGGRKTWENKPAPGRHRWGSNPPRSIDTVVKPKNGEGPKRKKNRGGNGEPFQRGQRIEGGGLLTCCYRDDTTKNFLLGPPCMAGGVLRRTRTKRKNGKAMGSENIDGAFFSIVGVRAKKSSKRKESRFITVKKLRGGWMNHIS